MKRTGGARTKTGRSSSARPRRRVVDFLPWFLAGALLLGLIGAMAIEPTRQLLAQRDRIETMSQELREVERNNNELRGRIRRLHDPDYIEQKAREQNGLILPGEIPVVVMPPSKAKQRTQQRSAADVAEPPAEPGAIEGFLRFIGWR